MVALAKHYDLKQFRNERAREQARLDQKLALMVPRENKDEDVSPAVCNRVRDVASTGSSK